MFFKSIAVLGLFGSVCFAVDGPVDLAQQFLKAYDAKNQGRQAILAAQPAGKIPYALAVHWLLLRQKHEAAAALVEQRHGPEREGLQRFLKVGLGAHGPSLLKLAEAEKLLKAGRPDDALRELADLGKPAVGSVFAAMVEWTRARALATGEGRNADEAARACLTCVKLARACGWLAQARRAARMAALHGREPRTRLIAAHEWVELCRLLDDPLGRIAALDRRAALHMAVARALSAQGGDEAAKARTRVRQDYVDAFGLARREGKLHLQARLMMKLALHWHFDEKRIKAARASYEKAEVLLDAGSDEKLLRVVRRNLAVVLTQLGQYSAALARLDKLIEGAQPPYDEGQKAALAQRAYALWRRGSIERAVAAYALALRVAPEGPGRERLRVEAGELELSRGDFEAARAHFDAVLAQNPQHVDARASRARVRGLSGDEEGALEDFRAAFKAAAARGGVSGDRDRVRVLLFRAQQERSWGRVAAASRTAQKALAIVRETKSGDHLNVGVTWLLSADLALLRGDEKAALQYLGRGGVLFVNLNEPFNAIGAYGREVLLLTRANRRDEALQRLVVMRRIAHTTPVDALKSHAFAVESFYEAYSKQGRGRLEQARALAEKALAHARTAHDRVREANALLQLARLKARGGFSDVEAALAALDARLVAEPEWHPAIDGERPDHAAGVGLSVLLRDRDMAQPVRVRHAYRLIERARRERILLALRGRVAILRATLEPDAFREFLRHRNAVRQAHAEKEGVKDAEAFFQEVVGLWRDQERLPGMELAFFAPAKLKDLQGKLTDGDVFLDMLDDPYARVMLVVTNKTAALRPYDDKDPAAAAAAELKTAKRLIVASDGRWAVQPFPAPGVPLVVYAASGSSYPGGADLPTRDVKLIDDAIPLHFDYPRATRAVPLLFGEHRRRAAFFVVAPNTKPTGRTARPRAEGATALVEALALGGARYVVVSVHGAPPATLLARFLNNCRKLGHAPPQALREAQEWYRAQNPKAPVTDWASLMVYRTG